MIIIETKFAFFKIKWAHRTIEIPNPANIYWIPTERIVYLTNYVGNRNPETTSLEDRPFPDLEKIRGKVLSGNWDVSNYKFTDLDAYRAFRERIEKGAEWRDTDFYKNILTRIESGQHIWNLKNSADLDKRCEYFDWLYKKIKNEGYKINRSNRYKNTDFDEITVNIGRNGEYLFQDGRHRLSIAKILGIAYVPVMVSVRHKKWLEFRKFIISYAESLTLGGKLYQPIVHPDLSDIPFDSQSHDYHRLMVTIAKHIEKKRGIMLDIGANLGFFCHKFEDLGYRCYAVENDPATFSIMEKVRIAENKKFKAINASIFDLDCIKDMHFDVVLALNIFHHFLKRKTLYNNLINLLENLKMDNMLFEPHLPHEAQMSDAFVNYSQIEFVDFIMKHTSFTKSEVIYSANNGRHVYLLSKDKATKNVAS
jgi:SAM-dependent methyltransferase